MRRKDGAGLKNECASIFLGVVSVYHLCFALGLFLNILTNEYAFPHLYTSLLRQLFPIKIQKRLCGGVVSRYKFLR